MSVSKLLKGLAHLLFLTIALIVLPGVVGHWETHYKQNGVVTSVNNEAVLVVDSLNNKWVFEGKGFKEGDEVIMEIFTNYTEYDTNDDEIVKIKKY